MRRVACIITRLNVGGPANQTALVAGRLRGRGFDTLLIHGSLSPGEGDMSYLLGPGVPTQKIPPLGRAIAPFQDLLACWQVYRALCRFRPEVVHTHTAKAGTVGRLAALAYNRTAGRRRPAGIAHTYHGHVFEGYFSRRATSLFIAIERWLARRTHVIVAIAPTVKTDIAETYRIAQPSQVRVIPLGLDLAPFAAVNDEARSRARAALGIAAGRTVVSTVGRLTDIKRHVNRLLRGLRVLQAVLS